MKRLLTLYLPGFDTATTSLRKIRRLIEAGTQYIKGEIISCKNLKSGGGKIQLSWRKKYIQNDPDECFFSMCQSQFGCTGRRYLDISRDGQIRKNVPQKTHHANETLISGPYFLKRFNGTRSHLKKELEYEQKTFNKIDLRFSYQLPMRQFTVE